MMMKLDTAKSPALALAVALTCFWAFSADAADVTLIDKGEIGLMGAMYAVSTGRVAFYQ
jgi:hypothetical protein